jgi:hypothetical protein
MEHVSVDTSDQQTFPWIPIRHIRGCLEENEVRPLVRLESRSTVSGVETEHGYSGYSSFTVGLTVAE